MDRVCLDRLSFFGRHGVHAEERRLGAIFEVDITMEANLQPAAQADDLALTIDYTRAYGIARAAVEGTPRNLIETVAEEIARNLLALESVLSVTVLVRKRPALGGPFRSVSVEVTRTRT